MVIDMKRRTTMQRRIILNTVKTLGNHPTADQVFMSVNRQFPSISRRTIYRNLDILARDDSLCRIYASGAGRYDHRLDNHAHILCSECGRFEDFEYPPLTNLIEKAIQKTAYLIESQSIVLTGTCPECNQVQTATRQR